MHLQKAEMKFKDRFIDNYSRNMQAQYCELHYYGSFTFKTVSVSEYRSCYNLVEL